MKMTCVQFARTVLRLTLSVGQSAWVSVQVDGVRPRDLVGPMRASAIEMFGDLETIPPAALRVGVANLGRDSFKTGLGAIVGLYKLVTCDLSRVGPGDEAVVAVVAPRLKTARIALKRAVAFVQRSPELRRRVIGEVRNDGFTLRRHDGHVVQFEVFAASAGGASLRGPSWIAVVFDEAAQFRDASAAVNDEALFAAVMPRLLPEGIVLFLSTPWSEEGLFFKLANENHGGPIHALVARASTLVMRDNDESIGRMIEAERARDPENASREFDALFMTTGGSLFFDSRSLDDAIDDSLYLPASLLIGERAGLGADLGLVVDSSAIVAVGAQGTGTRARLRVLQVLELRPEKLKPLMLSNVIRVFAGECRRFGEKEFTADAHVREPAREHATTSQVTIRARPEGPTAKFDTFVALRQAFTDRRIAIPRHARLLAQLRAVSIRPLPGGQWKISSPRRIGIAHGDLTAALVLAVHACGSGRNKMNAAIQALMDREAGRFMTPDATGLPPGAFRAPSTGFAEANTAAKEIGIGITDDPAWNDLKRLLP